MDEKLLRGVMPQDQWDAFHAKIVEWGVPVGDDCLDYGSVFLNCKACFELGWEARGEK